jgi:hypothetical protein
MMGSLPGPVPMLLKTTIFLGVPADVLPWNFTWYERGSSCTSYESKMIVWYLFVENLMT